MQLMVLEKVVVKEKDSDQLTYSNIIVKITLIFYYYNIIVHNSNKKHI